MSLKNHINCLYFALVLLVVILAYTVDRLGKVERRLETQYVLITELYKDKGGEAWYQKE
ncbi:hypothetical protein ABID29_001808 [Streptococcus rupicaprae]|uniref:Phage protein n=1 Tax=Streptococcus rupicaprae TaxID=759619 RepID=A0ABV2FJF3_9STRE